VNEELSGRNDELSRVNSDLLNLLGSVQIAIVMVTNDLRIRRFTPMAEKILNLIPTDIGRPIGQIKPNIDCTDLEKLITESVDTASIREQECRDRNGNAYLVRVRPYKNVENRIDGAVLVLIDLAEANRRYDPSVRE
jgi:two-component system CheB/CheR fusion protein